MINLHLNSIFKFSNLNIIYFYLSVIYLTIFSSNIRKKNIMIYFKTKILDILMIVPLFILTCNNLIFSSYKLLLLIIIFYIYNRQVSCLGFTPSIIVSFLYWYFSFNIITIISIIIKTNILKDFYYLFLYHSLIFIVFILTIFILLIPIIKKDIITKMAYPTDKKEYLLFSLFIICFFIFLILIFLFNINNISFDLIKTRYILFLLNLTYVFYYIFFIVSKFDNTKIEINIKESLDSDLILAASAKQEDHVIKKINYYTRLYSCVMKSDTVDPTNNYIYMTLQDLLDSFYQEYYTTDEIVNEIMSEKHLICDNLDIVFLLNIIKVDTSKIEKDRLKLCYAILSLVTDIVIVYSNRQCIKEKYIIANIIDFSDDIYLQVTSNTDKHPSLVDRIIDKNKIMGSNKYKYLNILVGQIDKNIKLNIDDEKLNFIIN